MMNCNTVKLPLALLASTLLFSGCTTLGPDFVKPEAPVSEQWTENKTVEPVVKTESVDYSSWWKGFNDPVLDGLIETAYEENLDLRQSGLRILEARAALGIAVGEQLPQSQEVNGAAAAINSSKNTANPLQDRHFSDYQLSFDAAWELDFWGRFRRGVESAEANLNASVADYDNALVALTAEVARAYVSIRTFGERIRLAEENVTLQKRSLEIADVRFRNGVVTELDVTQAKTLLLNTKALIPLLQTGKRQAENSLAILLGMPPREIRALLGEGENVSIPNAPSEVAVGIPADLLRRRPDIRFAELEAAAQSARIGIARADLFPSFSLVGSIGYGSKNTNDLFESEAFTGYIGPGISWKILNYGRIKNNVRVQDARFEQALVNYENTVLKAYQEVEDALVGFVRVGEQADYLADSVIASKRSVDLSNIQYGDGVIDYNRVITVQNTLVDQQDSWVAAKGENILYLITLYKALGGGWQIRQGNDFVPEEIVKTMRERTDWGDMLPEKDLAETPEQIKDSE